MGFYNCYSSSDLHETMVIFVMKLIKQVVYHSFRQLPIEVIPIQQLVANSLFNKVQIGPLMAQPYELIDMSDVGVEIETKPER